MSPRTLFHPLLARFGVQALDRTRDQRYSFSLGVQNSHGVFEERALTTLGSLLWQGVVAHVKDLGPDQQLEIVEVAGQMAVVEPRFVEWQDAIRSDRPRNRLNQTAASVIAGIWLELRRDCDGFGRSATTEAA